MLLLVRVFYYSNREETRRRRIEEYTNHQPLASKHACADKHNCTHIFGGIHIFVWKDIQIHT